MTLNKYLAKSRETQNDFAKRSGVAQSVLSRILSGGDAQGKNWALIAKATEYQVATEDHFPVHGAAA